jgi:hypothetical protein
VAAYDDDGGTDALFGVLGRDTEEAVARFDGATDTFSREELVDAPEGLQIAAIDATGPANAWLLGRVPSPADDPATAADESAAGARVLLFRRDADAREWRRSELRSRLLAADDPALPPRVRPRRRRRRPARRPHRRRGPADGHDGRPLGRSRVPRRGGRTRAPSRSSSTARSSGPSTRPTRGPGVTTPAATSRSSPPSTRDIGYTSIAFPGPAG